MKVLFVSSGAKNGSPGPIVSAQAKSVESLGVSVNHFTIKKKGFMGYLVESHNLRKFLQKDKFDLIHAHYGLSAVSSLLARRKEKLVVSFMGDDLVGSNREDGSVTTISLLLARMNAMFAKRFYNHSIVKSEEMHKQINTSTISLIPNGVEINIFRPKKKNEVRDILGFKESEKIILFVSNPSRTEKNFKLAKDAVTALNDRSIHLIPLSGINHLDLADYYSAADAMVLTSFHEGSPNVIKEAMACNCPIVSTRVGDVEWVLGDTGGCYLASFDPSDFAQKLNLALNFAKEKGSTHGRERIIGLGLDSVSVAKRIIEVYNKVLK